MRTMAVVSLEAVQGPACPQTGLRGGAGGWCGGRAAPSEPAALLTRITGVEAGGCSSLLFGNGRRSWDSLTSPSVPWPPKEPTCSHSWVLLPVW